MNKHFMSALMVVSLICFFTTSGCSRVEKGPEGTSNTPESEEITKWPDLSEAIDNLFVDYDKPYHPGGMTAVIYEGEVIHLKGYGAANREFNVPWTADTRYRIASETKSYTANAMLLLEDQGLLSLDDSVHKYLPELPNFGIPLKLKHCLQMSSGLWHDEYLMILAGTTSVDSQEAMYRLTLQQKKLDFEPGSYLQWSDTNFRITARVMEKVTGQPYSEVMADLIFKPHDLSSTSAPHDFPETFDNQGTTYTIMPDREWPPDEVRVGYPLSGGGSIITTMNDQITWIKSLLEKGKDGRSLFERMTERIFFPDGTPTPYRLGIQAYHHRGLEGWGLAGHTGTQWVHFPDIDLTISYFTNYLGGINMGNIARGMIDAFLSAKQNPHTCYLSQDNPKKDHLNSIPFSTIPEDEVKTIVGTYIEPQRGYILALSTREGNDLRCALLRGGGGPYLIKVGEGRYETDFTSAPVPRIQIKTENSGRDGRPSLLVLNADWAKPKRFQPVTALELKDIPEEGYTGRYYSEALDAFHSVREENGTLLLRAGAGLHGMQRFVLTPLGRDIFEGRSQGFGEIAPSYLAVKFERTSKGKVYSMRLSVNNVRDLVLMRVDCR